MFDKLKTMGAIAGLLKDKDRLRAAGERIKARAEEIRAEGEAGGGAVRVVASGKLKVLSIDVAPALVAGMAADDRTRGLAGSLIAEAVNAALAGAQRQIQEEIGREARGLGLDDLPGARGGLGGLLGSPGVDGESAS